MGIFLGPRLQRVPGPTPAEGHILPLKQFSMGKNGWGNEEKSSLIPLVEWDIYIYIHMFIYFFSVCIIWIYHQQSGE